MSRSFLIALLAFVLLSGPGCKNRCLDCPDQSKKVKKNRKGIVHFRGNHLCCSPEPFS